MSNAEKNQSLLPVYLFLGDDQLKKTTLYSRLLKRLEDQGDITFNSVVFDGALTINVSELLDALNTIPFASPLRMVTVQDIEKSSKTVTDTIIEYLADPLNSSVLVLTATKLKADSRLIKAIKKIAPTAIINCDSKKISELPAMVQKLAQNYGVSMGNDAAQQLVRLTGSSTVNINTELQKLAAYLRSVNKDSASKADVLAVVSKASEPSPWDFVGAFTNRDIALMLELLFSLNDSLAKTSGNPANYLLSLCVMKIREMLLVKSLIARGSANIATIVKRPDWQVKKIRSEAEHFTAPELRELLIEAADVDMRMKSGNNAQQELVKFLLSASR
ncbi:hypothetical protein FACS1894104_2190 [Actinomycetota bacterium]|nr:hypothetical protein FACS1894104_2190 [Actinomycetota bacterium]